MRPNTEKWLDRINRAGDRLGGASDLVASALGTYLRQWLRLFWYGVIALLAGQVVDMQGMGPLVNLYQMAGYALAVAFVAEFSIAIATEFFDYREVLVAVAVWFWWPWRNHPNVSNVLGDGVPTSSKGDAKRFLMR